MKRLILTLALLVGCSTTPIQQGTEAIQKPLGTEPSKIKVHRVKWLDCDGKICLTPEDGVKVNLERKDMVRYIQELQLLTCYHENSYKFCKKEEINEKH